MSRPALVMHCHHGLGMGHLVRSLALVEAFSRRFETTLIAGGELPRGLTPPPGVRLVELPPLWLEDDGSLGARGGGDVATALEQRRRLVLETTASVRPAVAIVEMYPFGRKKLAGEIEAMLSAARAAGAWTATSVRDLLVDRGPSQAAHDERAARAAERWLDAILVHGDPAFARFEESFRPETPPAVPIHHTGFVLPKRNARASSAPGRGLLVSAGGGRFGSDLLLAAARAVAALGARAPDPVTFVAGPFLPEPAWAELERLAPAARRIRYTGDFPGELARAALSISQCGYNTALDVVASRRPALVVPFVTARETEQLERARRLAERGLVRWLHPDEATPEALAREIEALGRFRPSPARIDLDGADNTARLVAELSAARIARRRRA